MRNDWLWAGLQENRNKNRQKITKDFMEKLEKNYCIQYTQLHIVLQVTIWLHCKCKKVILNGHAMPLHPHRIKMPGSKKSQMAKNSKESGIITDKSLALNAVIT